SSSPTAALFPYTTLFRSMRRAFVPFDQHQIDRGKLAEERTQRQLRFRPQLMHERKAPTGGHQHLGRAGHPMGMRILAGLIDVERSEEHTSELQSPDHLVC